MVMIETRLACELARAHQNYKTACLCCLNAPTPQVRDYWRRMKRQRRARFVVLAEELADKLIEEKYHGMEGV